MGNELNIVTKLHQATQRKYIDRMIDNKIKCISAASIIAKTYRDLFMIKLSKKFNRYAWEKNFGYGTKAHIDGLKKFGITIHHRKGFKPIHKMLLK